MPRRRIRWWDGQVWRPDPFVGGVSLITGAGAATATAITSLPSSVQSGASFTLSGTVKTLAGANATNGTVQVQAWNGSAWVNKGSAVSVSAGAWSRGSLTQTATTSYRAVYTPGSGFQASSSSARTIVVATIKTLTKTYNPSWGATYQSDGDKRSVAELYQGYYSSTNGNQRSLIGFPYNTIQADLAGATIVKVELYLYAGHWGPDSGGTAVIGFHAYTSEPATYTTGGTQDSVRAAWSAKTGGKWVDITAMPDAWASTTRGIVLGPGPSTALEYYGYFNGPGQANQPQLRITYTKYV